jgi:hypothetical protein
MSINFADEIKIKFSSKGYVMLLENFEFIYNGFKYTIPTGYEWNGANTPRFAWRITDGPTSFKNLIPSCCHDFAYGHLKKYMDRETADKIFYDALIYVGKPKIMWKSVRLFGGKHY